MISTDPPYYDNIGYADLSDFFYQPPLTDLDAYDVRLNPVDGSESRYALVAIVPQARGQARQTDDFVHWRRDAQGLAKMSAQQIADVAARSVRPIQEVSAHVTVASENPNDHSVELRPQFRIYNPSAAVASFAVLSLGVGWRNGLSMLSRSEWRFVETSDKGKVGRLVLASGSTTNWSPITPGFTLITDAITLRLVRLEQDVVSTRAVGLLRHDYDGGSRLYGVYFKLYDELAKQLFLVPFDEKVAQDGYLSDVAALPLFRL